MDEKTDFRSHTFIASKSALVFLYCVRSTRLNSRKDSHKVASSFNSSENPDHASRFDTKRVNSFESVTKGSMNFFFLFKLAMAQSRPRNFICNGDKPRHVTLTPRRYVVPSLSSNPAYPTCLFVSFPKPINKECEDRMIYTNGTIHRRYLICHNI